MLDFWQHIYSKFHPVAFNLGSIGVHWYGIMYALALISAILFAKWYIRYYKLNISQKLFDDYIWWAEIGVILGARIGFVLFYDNHTIYYLTHPWQIFNPFASDGTFVGISGMSFHGAFIGFVIATLLFCRKYKISFWFIIDITGISVPIAYIFGRVGNFVNQELIGRSTDVPWGIYVHGVLRHPSQLYEAILEGLLVFVILFVYKNKQKFVGEIGILYAILYSTTRMIAEVWRQPDIQLGFVYSNWLTQGMLLSFVMAVVCIGIYYYRMKKVI